jgi:hypothetical protein
MTWLVVILAPCPCHSDVEAYFDTLWLHEIGIRP